VTTRSMLTFAVVLGALGGLAGCKGLLKKKDAEPAASATAAVVPVPAPSAVPAVPEVAPPPVTLDESTVPAPQDFEDEAAEKVTPANFRTELARLQKEIAQ
jgi:hypothetical protein